MPIPRVPTLADARRQVWVRGGIGLLLTGLGLTFWLLVLVKHLYHTPAGLFFPPVGPALHRLIDPFLRDWLVLDVLWRAIPPWQPASSLEVLYGIYGGLVLIGFGGFLFRSAYARYVQIRAYRWEMAREVWRQQDREARGLAPDDRGRTMVIGQAVWYEYPAPPEPWSQTLWGVLVLGLIIALIGGLVVGVILLYAEYAYFQVRWPSGRN